MKKFTKIATVAVMTMVTAGVFAGCGLKGGKDIGKEAALEAALADAGSKRIRYDPSESVFGNRRWQESI